jgi:ankyrin repeat protein
MDQLLEMLEDKQKEEESRIYLRLRVFIDMGCDVNQFDLFGESLLIRSLDKHMNRVALLLLRSGADMTVKDAGGKSVIAYAFCNGNEEVVSHFIRAGIPLDIAEEDLHDAFASLCYTHREGKVGTDLSKLEFLLDNANIDINSINVRGDNLLFFAIDTKSPNLVKLFLDRGINLFVRNERGQSPLTFAQEELDRLKNIGRMSSITMLAESVITVLKGNMQLDSVAQ